MVVGGPLWQKTLLHAIFEVSSENPSSWKEEVKKFTDNWPFPGRRNSTLYLANFRWSTSRWNYFEARIEFSTKNCWFWKKNWRNFIEKWPFYGRWKLHQFEKSIMCGSLFSFTIPPSGMKVMSRPSDITFVARGGDGKRKSWTTHYWFSNWCNFRCS